MTVILVDLLIFFVCLLLIMLGSMWYMRFILNKMVGEKHRDLEILTSTGTVPEHWSRKYTGRMIRLREAGKPEALRRVEIAALKKYRRKLARLISYLSHTPLVESEEARSYAMQLLQRMDREWKEAIPHGSVLEGK